MLRGRTRYHTKKHTVLMGVLAGLGAAAMVGGIIEVTKIPSANSVLASVIVVGLFLGAPLVALLVFGVGRAARSGVYVGDRDVVVFNTFRTRRIPWDEIDRFSVDWVLGFRVGCVHLRDGSSLHTSGIQGQNSLFPKSRWAEDPIEDLNRLLEQRRGATPDGG